MMDMFEEKSVIDNYWDKFAQVLWDALHTELLFLDVDTSDENEMQNLTHHIYPNGEQKWLWKGQEIVSVEKLEPPSVGYKILQHNCTESVAG